LRVAIFKYTRTSNFNIEILRMIDDGVVQHRNLEDNVLRMAMVNIETLRIMY
jgi:hypothetical protein